MDHDSLVETIHQLEQYRNAAALDTPAYARLVENERELRARLASTPQHRAAQAAWRRRVEANKARRARAATPPPLECA